MQELAFVISFAIGVVVCSVAAVTLVARWQLPWHDTLVWFGVLSDRDRDLGPIARR